MPMSTTQGRIAGKSAVITGAALGIGRATAERFAQEGARLVLNDINEPALSSLTEQLQARGIEVVAVVGDVAQDADVQRMIQTAVDTYGKLDILVANAGIIPLSDILESTGEDFDRV